MSPEEIKEMFALLSEITESLRGMTDILDDRIADQRGMEHIEHRLADLEYHLRRR